MLTPYPEVVEYNEAVQHPGAVFKDPELRQGRVKVNALGLPVVLSGGFALTYQMTAPRRTLAVRCFHREIPAAQQKYAAIGRAVGSLQSPYFVGFEYVPDGIRIRGGFYPLLKMDWAEGDPLGVWLDRNLGNRAGLKKLREDFAALAAYLESHGIAHGDIQNGNVIISPTGLKLVDYDGVYVPGMPAEFGCETGHKHFQHPGRMPAHFGPTIDRFSFIAIDVSLAALIEDPRLHRRFRHGSETILFRAGDFADPEHSEVFRLLAQMPALDPAVRNFAAVCRADIRAVPSLAEFRAGSKIPAPATGSTAATMPTASTRAAVTSDGNRLIVERLIGGNRAPAQHGQPNSAQPLPPAAASGPLPRSNQDIVRGLGLRTALSPAKPGQPARGLSPRAQRGRPLPKSGSVVIHPRNPATQRPAPPPPPARPPTSPTEPVERRILQRVLRLIGFDA